MNIGREIVQELVESTTPIIALYPGKFKPPHAGHFNVVSKAANIADKVIVIMSNVPKDEFTPEDSMKVWRLYEDILPSNVQIIISGKSSPVSEVFDIIKDKATDFIVLYGKGEESRYRAIEKDPNTYSNVKIVDAGTFESLNATDLRNAIRNKDLEDIQKFLPASIDAKKVLDIYTQKEFKPGPILHELFEKGLPNIEKINSYEYKVGNGDDIEAIYYFNLEIPERNIWSVNWKFTDNNKNKSPEAWKQVTTTSFKIIKDFIDSRHPKALHISGNTDVKTTLYKTYAHRLEDLLNNEYKVDNKDEFGVVLRSIEESAKPSIKKRMETMNESYSQALNYWKNGDIFAQSKSERNATLKKYNNRKQISELYNMPFKVNPLLEAFTLQKAPLMKRFVEYACGELNINEPQIHIINSPTYSQEYKSFGGYIPSEEKIMVVVHNRNMADILRTLAHELVHHMQNMNGDELNGEDGSNIENEANAMAGVIMRKFGRENPEIFE